MTEGGDIAADVTLLREGRERSSTPPRARARKGGGPSASRKKATSSETKKRTPSRSPKRERKPDAETRVRHILSLALLLCGILLFIALLSYSRLDQANADISPTDLGGLLSNDPDIALRAESTINWLGLVGAYLAHTLVNGTIGWFSFIFPGLFAAWGIGIYRSADTNRIWQKTIQVVGAAILGAALFATISGFSWTSTFAYEWYGSVGGFLRSLFVGLIGSAGAFLVFLAGLIVLSLYLFDTNLKGLVDKLTIVGGITREGAMKLYSKVRSAISEEISAPRSLRSEKSSDADPVESADVVSHEPAHMIRRVRESRPDVADQVDSDDADPNSSAPRVATKATTPFPAKKQVQSEVASTVAAPDRISPASPMLKASEAIESIAEEIDTVTLSRAPVEENAPTVDTGVLRVHVEEGDSDDDQEMETEGNLIEHLKDEQISYDPPTIEMLNPQESHEEVEDEELKTHARLLQEKLRTFNIEIEDLTVTPGPVVTLFEFVPAAGIKLSQIESLGDDIALALKARGIRIIAPIPGKGTVGVEIPNTQPALVRIRSVLNTTKFREAEHNLPLALGKTTVGEVFCADLTKMPHLLIAGATGAGKSVGINSILISLLYKMHPSDLKLAIIDPKKIELTQYKALIEHYLVECPDIDEDIVTDPQNAVILLKCLELEMDRRYDMLAKSGQRNIFDYNRKIEEGALKPSIDAQHRKLPYIVLIIDELADLMITAAKEVEEPIARLAQLARAIGIHIIVATQRPSVDVLTGMIKANFPARIAYQVATKVDSRTILDMNGAEQLLGNGDMLYLPSGRPKPVRLQNAFVTTEEVEAVCEHIGAQTGYLNPYSLPSLAEKKKQAAVRSIDERDELFDEAARTIVRHQQGSVSLLQRRLKVGYARAARIVDELEDAGIVGPFDGSKARMVMLESEADLEAYL